LLDALEDIRIRYGDGLRVRLSHLCIGHNLAANVGLCVLATPDSLASHAKGHAIDISPTGATPAKCRALWNAAKAAATALDATCGEHSGEPSRAEFPEGFAGVSLYSQPDVQTKLNAGTALTAKEASAFVMHLQVIQNHEMVRWECWIRQKTKAKGVRIQTYDFGGDIFRGIIAVYDTEQDAKSESPPGSEAPSKTDKGWEIYLHRICFALDVRRQDSGIIGVFSSSFFAEAYKEPGSPPAWPVERQQ